MIDDSNMSIFKRVTNNHTYINVCIYTYYHTSCFSNQAKQAIECFLFISHMEGIESALMFAWWYM